MSTLQDKIAEEWDTKRHHYSEIPMEKDPEIAWRETPRIEMMTVSWAGTNDPAEPYAVEVGMDDHGPAESGIYQLTIGEARQLGLALLEWADTLQLQTYPSDGAAAERRMKQIIMEAYWKVDA